MDWVNGRTVRTGHPKTGAKSGVCAPAPVTPSTSSGTASLLPATVPELPVKRGRGRPRKSVEARVKKSFDKMIEDATPLMSPIAEDGGGTLETAPSVTRESLERRVSRRLNVLDRYLTDGKLHELLQISGLKEIGVYEGIMMDKALVLKGQPNVIVGSEERVKLNEVLPALMRELKRRNIVATASERKIEFKGMDHEVEPSGGVRSQFVNG